MGTDQGWFVHATKDSFSLEKPRSLTPATTGMNLEDIRLGDINQTQQGKYRMIPSHEVPRVVASVEKEGERWSPQAGGEGHGGLLFHG